MYEYSTLRGCVLLLKIKRSAQGIYNEAEIALILFVREESFNE